MVTDHVDLGKDGIMGDKRVEKYVTEASEEEITGAITEVLKAIREDLMRKGLQKIKEDEAFADQLTEEMKEKIQKIAETGRGGIKGAHGFNGEIFQCYGNNVKAAANGESPPYILLDDNGPTDYLLKGIPVQQKSCISGGKFGLDHVLIHSEKYPDFKNKGFYQIPKDLFEKIQKLRRIPKSEAGKLRREELRQWKVVHDFTEQYPEIDVQPMDYTYAEIQTGNVRMTVAKIETEKKGIIEGRKAKIFDAARPTISEGIKVTAVSTVSEGVLEGGTEVISKAVNGKNPVHFDRNDWKDVGVATAVGAGKGAIRGAVVYSMTNVVGVPAPVASGAVTLSLAVVSEGKKYANGEITGKEFASSMVEHSGSVAVRIAGVKAGMKVFRKHPLIGATVGGIAATLIYKIVWEGAERYISLKNKSVPDSVEPDPV